MTYATEQLHEEVAYLAFHFHWALDSLLDLEHADRLRYVEQIGQMNSRTSRAR